MVVTSIKSNPLPDSDLKFDSVPLKSQTLLRVNGKMLGIKTRVRARIRATNITTPLARSHQATRNTFITSSPRWLMTFTAIRPFFGFSNARDVSLFSVAHASGSISAFRVVLSAL